ncbi:hypothetical protein AGMMS50212_08930 [Spirochaetia bacterium]|nr:hypothetical protein AGMMS50212_08930 [Spirochaetia bacterium]
MKKIISLGFVLFALFGVCVGGFCQDFDGRIEIYGGFQFGDTTFKYDWPGNTANAETKLHTDAGVFGLAGVFFFGRVGFAEYANLMFPARQEYKATLSGQERKMELLNNDYAMFGFDNTLAFMVKVVDGEFFKLPVGVGIHFSVFSTNYSESISVPGITTKYEMSIIETTFGLGAVAGFELHVAQHFYFFGRAQFAYDFVGSSNIEITVTENGISSKESKKKDGSISSFSITPFFGFGINF